MNSKKIRDTPHNFVECDNFDETNQFLERVKLPELIQSLEIQVGTIHNSFHEDNTTLITKARKQSTRKL